MNNNQQVKLKPKEILGEIKLKRNLEEMRRIVIQNMMITRKSKRRKLMINPIGRKNLVWEVNKHPLNLHLIPNHKKMKKDKHKEILKEKTVKV